MVQGQWSKVMAISTVTNIVTVATSDFLIKNDSCSYYNDKTRFMLYFESISDPSSDMSDDGSEIGLKYNMHIVLSLLFDLNLKSQRC